MSVVLYYMSYLVVLVCVLLGVLLSVCSCCFLRYCVRALLLDVIIYVVRYFFLSLVRSLVISFVF